MNLFMQAQIEKHVIRYTQLSELLHITKEKPILVREDLLLNPQQRQMGNTAFFGTVHEIHYDTYTGMPKHLTIAETVAVFRAIKNDTSITIGRNGAVRRRMYYGPTLFMHVQQ